MSDSRGFALGCDRHSSNNLGMLATQRSARAFSKAAKLATILARPAFRRSLIRWRIAAAVEHTPIVRAIRAATLIDVGANIGQFSLVQRAECPGSRIYAFEPYPASAARYRDAFAGDSRVSLQECAIGCSSGFAPLHVSGRPDSSSLLPISSRQAHFAPGTEEVAVERVALTSLDETISAATLMAPVLLKIDVQGGELDVLRGAVRALRSVDYVYCELSFIELYVGQPLAQEVIEFLGSAGLRLCAVQNVVPGVDGLAVQADFLFARERGL